MSMEFELGSRVREKITGLEGVVIGRTVWMTGCVTYGVQPMQLKDGAPMDAIWWDGIRLELLPDPAVASRPKGDDGGPCPMPVRQVRGA